MVRYFRLIALTSTALISTAALAQTTGDVPPPTRYVTDENGVNMANGAQWGVATEASIGLGEGTLAHQAGWGVSSDGSSFSLKVFNVGTTWTATIFGPSGRVSKTFSKSGTTFTSLDGDGSTFADTGTAYVLTLANGTVYTYGNRNVATSDSSNVRARITQIELPDRSRQNMSYQQVTYCSNLFDACQGGVWITKIRLQGVTNTYGYQLHYNYQTNSANTPTQGTNWDKLINIRALNMGVDACDPAASTCTYSQAWPQTSYSTTLAGNDTITAVTDPLLRTTRYTRGMDGIGVYLKVKRPGSSTDNLVVRVDSAGRVTQIVRDGLTWQYAFTASGTVMTAVRTNPNGTTRTVVSNMTVGLPTSFTDELGKTTSYTYDATGRLTRITLPEGNYVQLTYDGRGNVTEERQVSKTPGTPPDIVLTAGYSATCSNTLTCNKPNWTKDAKGNQTDYAWDATHGGLVTVTAPADPAGVRPQARYGYTGYQAYFKNTLGSIVASGITQYEPTSVSTCVTATSANPASCVGTINERKTTTNFGPQVAGTANNLLPVSTTVAAGDNSISATTAFTYDSIGNRTKVDGPLPGSDDITVTRYDAARQVVGVVSPDPDGGGARTPIATRTTYNADGQVTKQELGTVTDQSDPAWANFTSAQQQETTYDSFARPIKSESKANGTTYALTAQSYDSSGRPDCSAVRMDPAQWASQTDACTPQTTGPNGPDRVTRPTYDNANRVIAVTTALGTAEATTESTTYTDNGLQKTVKDGENNLTTNEYDGQDRLVKTRYPVATKGANTSSTTDFEAMAYDPNGNVTTRTLRDGSTIAFTYDNLNRTTSRTPQGESTVSYGYNLLGQTTQSADAQTLTYSYDGLGRLTSESQPFGSAVYQRDAAGRMTRLTWSDGLFVNYDYDNLSNVTAIRENGATSGVGVLANYGYDSLARRASITRGNGTIANYGYDPVGRLSCLTDNFAGGSVPACTPAATGSDRAATFGWNPASQITSTTQANDAYAWTSAVNVDRPYTSNGLNQYSTAGATSFGYDLRGNLTSLGAAAYGYSKLNRLITAPGITLDYDPAGRLTKYNVSGATLRFSYAGSALIQETNGSNGAMLRRYVPGAGTDETVVWYEGAGTSDRRWLHGDERGSVVATSDGTGNMLAINRYDEYGIPTTGNVGRFQYTGQAWLPELGMYNYKARIYSPTLGRFMQTDPIGYDDGLNWYNYVGSDPINATDPSGLMIYDACTGSRLCQRDGSGGTISFGSVASSLGPSQGGIAARRPGSLTVTCTNCGSLGAVGSDGSITVVAPTYSLAYSSSAYFLIATAGAAKSGRGILDYARDTFCALPPIEISGGADAYLGIGASASLGISLDIRTLQVRGSVGATLGVGFGGGLGVGLGGGASKPGFATEITGTVAGGPGSITVGQGGVGGGSGPKFGPQLGTWGGVAGKYTTPATPNLTGACK